MKPTQGLGILPVDHSTRMLDTGSISLTIAGIEYRLSSQFSASDPRL